MYKQITASPCAYLPQLVALGYSAFLCDSYLCTRIELTRLKRRNRKMTAFFRLSVCLPYCHSTANRASAGLFYLLRPWLHITSFLIYFLTLLVSFYLSISSLLGR
ncbi:hypothetical protein BDF19DRAFT_122107 [Syncephalis fuscata]|nr:hypothetical protein BDF19DRAFT_122107 [Syncephalis fuscata]